MDRALIIGLEMDKEREREIFPLVFVLRTYEEDFCVGTGIALRRLAGCCTYFHLLHVGQEK